MVGRKGVVGVGGGRDRSVVLNPGDVERMGFDFDEFDAFVSEGTADVSEGTAESERNPWDLVVDPVSGELVTRESRGLSEVSPIFRGALSVEVVDIDDAVEAVERQAVLAARELNLASERSPGAFEEFPPGLVDTEGAVEELYARVMQDLIASYGTPLRESDYGDHVWDAIHAEADRRGWQYDNESGRFVPWDPEIREHWTDPLGSGPSVHESRAVASLTGLEGFDSVRLPPGPPGVQAGKLPVSPPSLRRQSLPAGSPGFSAPDSLLKDLVVRMGGEPPRVGRVHPEGSGDGRDGGEDYKPGAPLSEEQRRINQRGLEEARDVLRRLGGSVGDMPLEHKLALAAALVGAGLLTVGTGGFAGPALMAGGGLSLLGNQ